MMKAWNGWKQEYVFRYRRKRKAMTPIIEETEMDENIKTIKEVEEEYWVDRKKSREKSYDILVKN
jgi:hypothetical protein